jgi:hypothetical protein
VTLDRRSTDDCGPAFEECGVTITLPEVYGAFGIPYWQVDAQCLASCQFATHLLIDHEQPMQRFAHECGLATSIDESTYTLASGEGCDANKPI